MIDLINFFATIDFEIYLKMSLLDDAQTVGNTVLEPGLEMSVTATASFVGLVDMNMTFSASSSPGVSPSAFAENPLSILQNSGMEGTATVLLPFDWGLAVFEGQLSKDRLLLSVDIEISLLGIILDLALKIDATREEQRVELSAVVSLGPFADLDVYGLLSSDGLIASAALDVDLLFFRANGNVDLVWTDTTKKISFDFSVCFSGLGSAAFSGEVLSVGYRLAGRIEIQSFIGFQASAGAEIAQTTGQVGSFTAQLNVTLPSPISEVAFQYTRELPPINGGRRSLKGASSSPSANASSSDGPSERPSYDMELERLRAATGFTAYEVSFVKNDGTRRPHKNRNGRPDMLKLNMTSDEIEHRLEDFESMYYAEQRGAGRPKAPSSNVACSPIEYDYDGSFTVGGWLELAMSFYFSTDDGQISLTATATVLGTQANFAGHISPGNFSLLASIDTGEVNVFGFGKLQGYLSFALNIANNEFTLILGAGLRFEPADWASWFLPPPFDLSAELTVEYQSGSIQLSFKIGSQSACVSLNANTGALGRCSAQDADLLLIGDDCDNDEECASGRCAKDEESCTVGGWLCDKACFPKAVDGADCYQNVYCESGYCMGSYLSTGTCTAKNGPNQVCPAQSGSDSDSGCTTGICCDISGSTDYCSDAAGKCPEGADCLLQLGGWPWYMSRAKGHSRILWHCRWWRRRVL